MSRHWKDLGVDFTMLLSGSFLCWLSGYFREQFILSLVSFIIGFIFLGLGVLGSWHTIVQIVKDWE